MADIKRLLNKNGWTGRELGIIELTNMALNFQQRMEGKEPKDLVERAHFQRMLNSITDQEQGRIYNGYIAIHEWLSLNYNIAQTQLQQAQLQFRTLIDYLSQATLAEDVYRYIEQLPAIMTEKQYKDAIEAGRNSFLAEADGSPRGDSLPALIERGIVFYTKQLQTAPTKANPLKAIRKKYVAEPVKSNLILDSYNEVMGEGYYTLEDGRRSDEMTDEEWHAALSPSVMNALAEMTAEDGSGAELSDRIAQQRLIDRARVIFHGGTEEDADEAQQKKDYERGLAVPTQWHYYETPPKDLTKWDIVETGLWEFYGLLFCGMDGSEEEYQEELEDFLREFKELVDAIIADIETRYLKGKDPLQPLPVEGREPLKKIASYPLEYWSSTVFDWKDLYSHDVYGMKAEATEDTTVFDGNYRALFNGIAILRPSNLTSRSPRIDKNGYYAEPDIRHTLSNFTLEAFFQEAEDYATNAEIVESAREILLDSYYFLKGYDLALEMIASYYDVPEITAFQMPLSGLEDKIDAYNGLAPILYKKIKDTHYRDKELKEKKLQVIKDFFTELDYKSIEIPAENIERAKALFPDFKAFQTEQVDTLYNILCIRPQADIEEGGLD